MLIVLGFATPLVVLGTILGGLALGSVCGYASHVIKTYIKQNQKDSLDEKKTIVLSEEKFKVLLEEFLKEFYIEKKFFDSYGKHTLENLLNDLANDSKNSAYVKKHACQTLKEKKNLHQKTLDYLYKNNEIDQDTLIYLIGAKLGFIPQNTGIANIILEYMKDKKLITSCCPGSSPKIQLETDNNNETDENFIKKFLHSKKSQDIDFKSKVKDALDNKESDNAKYKKGKFTSIQSITALCEITNNSMMSKLINEKKIAHERNSIIR